MIPHLKLGRRPFLVVYFYVLISTVARVKRTAGTWQRRRAPSFIGGPKGKPGDTSLKK
jgi:hypothetical protein